MIGMRNGEDIGMDMADADILTDLMRKQEGWETTRASVSESYEQERSPTAHQPKESLSIKTRR